MAAAKTSKPAVFLDRDGVLNADSGYVHRLADLRILPGVAEALIELRRRGFLLIVVSNQSGVARGMFDAAAVEAFNAELLARLKLAGASLDDAFYCPHHPDGKVAAYRQACDCRKPATGMIKAAMAKHAIDLRRSFLVGDKADDIECAVRAGIRGLQVARPGEKAHPQALAQVASLLEAVPLMNP